MKDDRSYLFRREGELKKALLKLGAAASSDGQLHFENVARQTAAFDAVGYITHLRPRERCRRSPRAWRLKRLYGDKNAGRPCSTLVAARR